jgi:hypothetical protein
VGELVTAEESALEQAVTRLESKPSDADLDVVLAALRKYMRLFETRGARLPAKTAGAPDLLIVSHAAKTGYTVVVACDSLQDAQAMHRQLRAFQENR